MISSGDKAPGRMILILPFSIWAMVVGLFGGSCPASIIPASDKSYVVSLAPLGLVSFRSLSGNSPGNVLVMQRGEEQGRASVLFALVAVSGSIVSAASFSMSG